MQRRQFLAASLATSALALTREAKAQPSAGHAREFYQIRKYKLGKRTADKAGGKLLQRCADSGVDEAVDSGRSGRFH